METVWSENWKEASKQGLLLSSIEENKATIFDGKRWTVIEVGSETSLVQSVTTLLLGGVRRHCSNPPPSLRRPRVGSLPLPNNPSRFNLPASPFAFDFSRNIRAPHHEP
ncbi:hypothetical protein PIB30_059536 [Stylosanthes scabra]|uniref:Uncharacterized protein n=1 Tax=Stylosanthes scabra TaxID=79078 RepID=A0ABU6TK09_9FABA|nr:hypothetical protein [Stylosanthes scabra]